MEVAGERPIGAGTIAVAISGDNARVVTLPAEAVHWAREVPAPPSAGNLPGGASGVFVGREEDLDRVRGLLCTAAPGGDASGGVVVTQTGAVHGLGGVGKSTLALHYAHQFRSEYGLVWWITSDTPEAIVSGLAALALRLCPQWAGTAGVDEQAAWAITWLGWHPGWLLIFDNVEEPTQLHPYLGALTGGHVLATSRRATGWHRIGPSMPLDLLTPQAAADLLCRLAFGGQEPTRTERAQSEALARDLGFLPLALEQAGAYAYETGCELGEYRESLGLMLDETASDSDPERTIARIWSRTLIAIEERNPLAVELLYAMAWLAPDDIPRTLLEPLAPDTLTLGKALGVLHAYNMVTFTSGQGVSVHRLVQTVLRANHETDPTAGPRGLHEAERAVCHALPSDQNAEAAQAGPWERLIPHLTALAESTPSGHSTSSDLSDVYYGAAQHLFRQGRDGQSLVLRKAILAQRVQTLGDTHPETLISRNNLALAYQSAGDLERAAPLFAATLAQQVQVLGDNHPETLTTRHNLALTLRTARDLERAVPLFEATLAQEMQVLGDTHRSTLRTRSNLAVAYMEAGDLERAVPLFEAALAQQAHVLGDSHPETLETRGNLALAYQRAGDLERAVPLVEATIAQQVKVLGDSHPATLSSRNNLATAYVEVGDLERAAQLLEANLAQHVQVLGDSHISTLITRHNLASVYMEAGDLERVAPLFEANVAQQVKVLGDSHPETLASRHNLAVAYQRAGDLERAVPLCEANVAQRVKVLGDSHPETLASRNNLALAYESAGDLERAVLLFEKALTDAIQALGEEHPLTATVRGNLASALVDHGVDGSKRM